MQQFARRPSDDPNEPSGLSESVPSEGTLTQLLEEITALKARVAQLSDVVAELKGETHTAKVFEPVIEEPAIEVLEAVQNPVVDRTTPAAGSIDEESVVELLRGAGTVGDAPMSNEAIQAMLEEAAREAMSVAKDPQGEVPVAEVETAPELHVLEGGEPVDEDVHATEIAFERAAVAIVPSHLAIAALAIPVRVEGNTLYCRSVEPFDQVSLDLIGSTVAHKVIAEPAPMDLVVSALREAYSGEAHAINRDAAWELAPTDLAPRKRRGFFRRSA